MSDDEHVAERHRWRLSDIAAHRGLDLFSPSDSGTVVRGGVAEWPVTYSPL